MALIVDANDKYLSGSGGSFASSPTELTVAVWVKSIDYDTYAVFAAFGPDEAAADSINVGRAPSYYLDGFLNPSANEYRLTTTQSLTQDNTTWHHLAVTFKEDVAIAGYKDGSALFTDTTSSGARTNPFVGVFDLVKIGQGLNYGSVAWNTRSRIAHVAFWDLQLTAAEVLSLYSGGTGGGKSPTAVQGSNLKFYATLITDATVHTGGISLSATGSPSYDSDNPTVDSPGGGAGPGEDDLSGSSVTGGHGTAAPVFAIEL
jgi:hypothetical protein